MGAFHAACDDGPSVKTVRDQRPGSRAFWNEGGMAKIKAPFVELRTRFGARSWAGWIDITRGGPGSAFKWRPRRQELTDVSAEIELMTPAPRDCGARTDNGSR